MNWADNNLLKEYRINNSKYNVNKIRHYTTLKSLLSILKLGYIRPHKSRGDRDYAFLPEEELKAVSFLDSNIDTEERYILSQNDRRSTINGLTDHLALHMDKISAMIEVDLDKYEKPESVRLMSNFKNAYEYFIEHWNEGLEQYKARTQDWINLYKLEDAYVKGGEEAYYKALSGMTEHFAVWVDMYRHPRDGHLPLTGDDRQKYKEIQEYDFKPLTEEEAAQLKSYCEDCDLVNIYKSMKKLGFDKKIFDRKTEIEWLFPNWVTKALWMLRSLMYDKAKHAPVELRVTEKVYLNKSNSTIYIFTGLAEGTGTQELLPEFKQYEDKYNIKYIEPGQKLQEKVFPTSTKLTYEEACSICKTPKRFLKYIRDHKDEYYTKGEFDKVEPSLQYITDFIYGDKYCYTDYLDMIQEYFDEILPLGKEGDVDIYRGVKLESEDDFDWNDMGNCWTYDWDSAVEFLKYFQEERQGKPYMLSATTDRDNIDWILSICLNLTHINEKELRVYDINRIEDPYIEEIDEDTDY